MERDILGGFSLLVLFKISTHTLTWSVTILSLVILAERIFQLTRSRGAWHQQKTYLKRIREFQLTRSRGAWLCETMSSTPSIVFQLTRSRGAWRISSLQMSFKGGFQLTRSRGAWLRRLHSHQGKLYHFNSHAHVERDLFRSCTEPECSISTHTLTWSVTRRKSAALGSAVFQLTRSRGAWHRFRRVFPRSTHFNSHAHVERDNYVKWQYDFNGISTHTLTWSVTPCSWRSASEKSISTHTLTWSVTNQVADAMIAAIISTHTLTWSVTTAFLFLSARLRFQLTRSRGAWHHVLGVLRPKNQFQLTRSRGAWLIR